MAHDRKQIEQLTRSHTEAWCSRDPARVAGLYVPGGMITINGGDAARIAEVAEAVKAKSMEAARAPYSGRRIRSTPTTSRA